MNRSMTQKSTSKKASTPAKYNVNQTPSSSTNSTLYFCHYKNAMYMGGIKSFKKDGKGILIHDCGLSVVTNYTNDLMHGHNIFFSQHCLLSAQYVKGKIVDAAYRTDGYMAHLLYNNDGLLQGKNQLLNFINKSIIYANFRKGVLVEKQEEKDITLLNKVFQLGQYDFLIGRVHASTLKYDIKKVNNIESQKFGNKLTIGFEKGGLINGLAFTLIFRGIHGGYNPQTHRNQDEFELRIIERGYMSNSQLNGFGEKLFKNGNLYIGEFRNGIFEGNGILKNTTKKNWVSGFFEKGNLVDLLEYNNEGQEKTYDKIVEAMHQRKTNWINNEIILFDLDIFDKHIEKMLSVIPNSAVKSLEQRKQDVLKKIQDNFLCQPNSLPSFLQTAKADLKIFEKQKEKEGKDSIRHFVHSFIPQQTKQRKTIQDQNSIVDGYQLSASRRMPNSIRKSKIFQRTTSFDHYLRAQNSASRRNISRTPENKKKIFNLSTAPTKPRQKDRLHIEIQGSPQNFQKEDLANIRSITPPALERLESSLELNSNTSNHDIKERTSNKKDIQKSLGKSKIFRHLQNQAEQIAPKFIYTKIDTIKDSEKRKRLGMDYIS